MKQLEGGNKLTITDERMTRFWLSLEQGVRFVIRAVELIHSGEVFVPKIPSMKIMDLARAVATQAEVEIIGIRPGEKLHEVLIHEDEARSAVELDDMFVIQPAERLWFGHNWQSLGRPLADGYRYVSDTNPDWLTIEKIPF